jgi:hypothetical protein
MHLLPSVAIQPNLELKTRLKQLLDSLPLVIALPRSRPTPSALPNNVKRPILVYLHGTNYEFVASTSKNECGRRYPSLCYENIVMFTLAKIS